MYTINEWYGRFGNNIQQISNAIFFCKENSINFYCPPHPLLNKIEIKFGSDSKISSRFYFFDKFNDGPKDFECNVEKLNEQRREICLKYITPNFNFFVKDEFDDTTLVIHIRSGDVFSNNPPNTFVQNPLSFYLNIIKNYEEILVVTEKDMKNPIINQLKKNKKVLIQATTLQNDISTLLRAKNLVSSGVGSFCPSIALCSKNLKKFYYSSIFTEECLNPNMLKFTNIELCETKISNYIEIGKWTNCSEQRKLLLEA